MSHYVGDRQVCRFGCSIQTSLPYNGYRVFPRGKKRPERHADPSPPSSAVFKKG